MLRSSHARLLGRHEVIVLVVILDPRYMHLQYAYSTASTIGYHSPGQPPSGTNVSARTQRLPCIHCARRIGSGYIAESRGGGLNMQELHFSRKNSTSTNTTFACTKSDMRFKLYRDRIEDCSQVR